MNMQILDARRDAGGGYRVDVSRGERVGRVSSEWFSRPADQRYLSLNELARTVRDRMDRSHTRVIENALIHVEASRADPERLAGPVFARASFEVDEPGTLFLDTTGWGKGVAWVNGFNLGRYWTRGPQETLYVPGPVVRAGRNELVILELESAAEATAAFVAEPRLGHTDF